MGIMNDLSPKLEEFTTVVDGVLAEGSSYGVAHAPAFYLLDRLGVRSAENYVLDWKIEECPSAIFATSGNLFYYMAELYEKHQDKGLAEKMREYDILARFEENQKRTGYIGEFNGPPLLGLVGLAPNSDVTQASLRNTEARLAEALDGEEVSHKVHPGEILALAYLDYSLYEEKIREYVDKLSSEIMRATPSLQEIEEGKESWEEFFIEAQLPNSLKLLYIVPENYSELANILAQGCLEDITQYLDDPSERWNRISHASGLGISLLFTDYGPSLSQREAYWNQKLKDQELERSKPAFVCTYPSAATKSRRLEIRNQAESMIDATEDTLRISSLRIDLLHEPIFDLIEEKDSVDVRVLTNTGKAGGTRKKMKRAVMEEMVRKTEGGVKEHDLVHTRMLIRDDEEVMTMTADLTRDQMHDEFNVGMHTKDRRAVKEAIDFFDDVWNESEHRN